ncbi:MAG: hypothetical protein OXG85_04115 [Chloroflexi bacterium]|nr:hypothetical protein [Chloroflexota bacterium]
MIILPTKVLNYIFLILLYVPVGFFSYKWLIPQLSPFARRMASIFLVAQSVIIVMSLIFQSSIGLHWWLWDLNTEWNIATAFASTQFVLVCLVALYSSWQGRGQHVLLRLYLAFTAILFFFFALDELLQFHETSWQLQEIYNTLGIVFAVLTVIIALRGPTRSRVWLLCLLAGLGAAWFGATVLERYRDICGYLGPLPLSECLEPYRYEEPIEFLGVWLALVAVLGLFSQVSIPLRLQRTLYWLPVLCIIILLLTAPSSPFAIQVQNRPPSVAFATGEELHDYRIRIKDNNINVRLPLSLAAEQSDFTEGLGFSIHLVDQATGISIAHKDESVHRKLKFRIGLRLVHIYRQVADILIPPDAPTNRALWIVLTLWRRQGDDFIPQTVLSSDLELLSDAQIILDELVFPAEATPVSSPPLASFDNGFALETVEWRADTATSMPEGAQAGEQLNIIFAWRSDGAGLGDYSQFLHFVHTESGEWWGYDQSPLGPRLPTRLWYAGLADSETWHIPVPSDLAPGRYDVFTGLYRISDQERLPVTDADGTPWLDNRVALGSLIIE